MNGCILIDSRARCPCQEAAEPVRGPLLPASPTEPQPQPCMSGQLAAQLFQHTAQEHTNHLESGPLLQEQSVTICILNCWGSSLKHLLFLDFPSSLPILLHSVTDTDLYKLPKLTAACSQNSAVPHRCFLHYLQHPDQHSPLQEVTRT